jgi:Ribbon-helix-helix protein, copG family.
MKRVIVKLSDDIIKKLEEIQARRGHLTLSETVRAVLGECLEEKEKKKVRRW